MRLLLLGLLSLLAAVVLPSSQPLAAQSSAQPLCFPGIPGIVDCLDGTFRPFWEGNGGLAVFGYPIGPALPEETANGLYKTQHFERNRLEYHADKQPPYDVLLGRLGAELLQQRGVDWRSLPAVAGAPAGCRYYPETRHALCGALLRYWDSHGLEFDGRPGTSFAESLALFGYPISEAQPETNSSGDRVLTQWFERARLEYHPDKPEPYTVLQGLLNRELLAALTPPAPPPGFVQVSGDQLVQAGQPVLLRGLNYYPSAHPWAHMWMEWDGPAIASELARARRELGINALRILVPYRDVHGWTDKQGNVAPEMLDRLRQFMQIAGQQQIKVIVTLFDWYDYSGPAGSPKEQAELRYLRSIVGAFKDDDRVLAWDLHNEPDNYAVWQGGDPASTIEWLGRMADALRAIDSRHPLTVGVGRAASLWQPARNGRTLASISDIISVHSYDAAAIAPMLRQVRAQTSKPILLEEFGWPTGPECRGPHYDEASQLFLYRQALAAAQQERSAGMFGWWFQDPPATLSYSADENGYFGLYERDGRPKAAIGPFRVLRVPALPSAASTSLPLTTAPPRYVEPEDRPLVFDDGMVLRDQFKHFWFFFGGEQVFGRPLTLATRDHAGKLVQYFERARFELNEAEHVQPIDPDWAEGQRPEVYLDRVHLAPLGQQALAGRSFPRVPDPGQPEVLYFPHTGHTLGGAFRALWETRGELFFGPPLSEPFDEQIDGQLLRVQYFTYWRFEQQGDGPVRLARLGVPALQNRWCPRP